MLHVVVGIVINSEQKILIAQRLAHQEAGGIWEFPGGKVEVSEEPYAALVREFKEEIGIEITHADKWLDVEYEYPKKKVLLDTWIVKAYEGIAIGNEGQEIRWIGINELSKYVFPEGNKLILQKLTELF